tara:strand:+ start:21333 stop:21509 length:177 start_codon:yes stop_codon:yes gene_type:complete
MDCSDQTQNSGINIASKCKGSLMLRVNDWGNIAANAARIALTLTLTLTLTLAFDSRRL